MGYFPEALADRYRRFKFRHFAPNQDHYEQLATYGQNPEVMVVSCCDSRCDPETIFSAMPGELFVVRNVANLVPPYEPDGEFHSTSAALEFAVQALKVKHIVVMGHGRCGGIRAALTPDQKPLSPGDFIGRWMEMISPAAKAIGPRGDLPIEGGFAHGRPRPSARGGRAAPVSKGGYDKTATHPSRRCAAGGSSGGRRCSPQGSEVLAGSITFQVSNILSHMSSILDWPQLKPAAASAGGPR